MWYIALVAVVNLGLGFALAYYLGRPWRRGAAGAISASSPSREATSFAELFDAMAGQDRAEGASPPDEEAADVAASPPEPPPENDERSPSRLAIEAFQRVVDQGRQRLQEEHGRLRAIVAVQEVEAIGRGVATIAEAVREYASASAEAYATFEAFPPESEDFRLHGRQLAEAVASQAKAIEEAVASLDAFDGDRLDASAKEAIAGLDLLQSSADRLRDRLSEALVALARAEETVETSAPADAADPLCDLPNRLGFEIHLGDWWKKDPQRIRKLTLGALDVDELEKVNRRWGYDAGDRLLARLGKLIQDELGERGGVARVSGTRFALYAADEDTDAVVRLIEQIRQTIETAQIQLGEERVQITASGAVTGAGAEDTCQTLLDRLDAGVREAKRTGRNRTFLHDGTNPTSVVPPNMTPTAVTMDLTGS